MNVKSSMNFEIVSIDIDLNKIQTSSNIIQSLCGLQIFIAKNIFN